MKKMVNFLSIIFAILMVLYTYISNYYGIFKETEEHVYKFSSSITTYDHNLGLKSALEEAYTLYHKHRHTTFHVDSIIESSRILSFDDALDIIKEALRIINRICNNW